MDVYVCVCACACVHAKRLKYIGLLITKFFPVLS